MIETYKILHNIYDQSVTPTLMLNKFNSTTGNNVKLEIQGYKHDFYANSFRVREPHIWNNILNSVINPMDVNQFKTNLDNNMIYIYKAQPPKVRFIA